MPRWTPGYSSPITLQLVGPQSWTEVPALLCYEPSDPFAVLEEFVLPDWALGSACAVWGGGGVDGDLDAEGGGAWL